MDYKKSGRKIRTQRRFLGMTQEQLAERCGISTAFIGHIERGARILSVETLFKICKVLGLSADDLMGL